MFNKIIRFRQWKMTPLSISIKPAGNQGLPLPATATVASGFGSG